MKRSAAPASGTTRLLFRSHGIRRFVTAADSVAAPKSKTPPEMFRDMIRTVLLN